MPNCSTFFVIESNPNIETRVVKTLNSSTSINKEVKEGNQFCLELI